MALLSFLAAAISTHAQTYSIEWHTIHGGGGTSTGGVYTVAGTIGQLDANPQPLSGGGFSLVGEFWALVVVQTPGAPLLLHLPVRGDLERRAHP